MKSLNAKISESIQQGQHEANKITQEIRKQFLFLDSTGREVFIQEIESDSDTEKSFTDLFAEFMNQYKTKNK